MVHRFPSPITIILIGIALLAVLSLGSAPASGADATPISCPNGATVVLQGQAPPNEALLAFLEKRSVGGGSSDRSGRYRIPLKLRERPGIYLVEVRLRSSRAIVGRYECYVDVPLANQLSPTPEIVVTAARTAQPTATAQPGQTSTARPTAAPTSRTASPTSRTASPTSRTAAPTAPSGASPTTTRTGTAGASPTTTPVGLGDVEIFEVAQVSSDNPDEYLTIQNLGDAAIDISGWTVINTTRADRPSYTFSGYTLGFNGVLDLYTGAGIDDVSAAIFYWNRTDTVWRTGDVAELRDGEGRLIYSYTVLAP